MKRTTWTNIYKTTNGTFRARKWMNGKRMSKNFTTLTAAKTWLTSLMTKA
jgi:hypothetical protein